MDDARVILSNTKISDGWKFNNKFFSSAAYLECLYKLIKEAPETEYYTIRSCKGTVTIGRITYSVLEYSIRSFSGADGTNNHL